MVVHLLSHKKASCFHHPKRCQSPSIVFPVCQHWWPGYNRQIPVQYCLFHSQQSEKSHSVPKPHQQSFFWSPGSVGSCAASNMTSNKSYNKKHNNYLCLNRLQLHDIFFLIHNKMESRYFASRLQDFQGIMKCMICMTHGMIPAPKL